MMDALSTREKAAQLLFPRLGSNMPPPVAAAEDADRVARLLDRCPVGGLLVFNGRYPDIRDALSLLQKGRRIPLLVASDMERGVGQQIRGATVFPHAMAYSAVGEEAERLVEESARIQAREAIGCGIHLTFSPVADVNLDPRNPIIATRAFSSDPGTAARLVGAFVRGCRAEGVLTAAKHFPGHGDTSQDSHEELPVVSSSREQLEALDLMPFRAAIEAGVDLIMTAHVRFPSLDPSHPATLSPAILRDLLRGELGFEGAVVTDSLLMGAIRESYADAGEQAAALVAAGVDILLDVPDPQRAMEGIARGVETGTLEVELLDAAVRRVLALKDRMKGRFGGDVFCNPELIVGSDEIGSAASHALSADVASRAVTIVDERDGCIPLAAAPPGDVAAILIKPHRTRFDPDEEPFLTFMRDALPGAYVRQIDPDDVDFDAVRERLEGVQHVVVAIVVKPAAWHAFGLRPAQEAFVRRLAAEKRVVLASLGSPIALEGFEQAGARICTFSDVEVSQRALVDRLLGLQPSS